MSAAAVDPDPEGIDIAIASCPDTCRVTVAGEIDARSAPVLCHHLLEAARRPDVTVVELDLRGVTFLGAAGLSALVTAHRAAEDAGRVLRMRCGSRRAVLRPMQITGLYSEFRVVDALPEGFSR